jgi:peptide/nickel transport system substrate-binding protein
MWESLGFPLDTLVPPLCGVWHNDHVTPDYKESDVAAAQAELLAGGFIDVDGDGYVEAPNGDDFVFHPMYSIESPQWGAAMAGQVQYWDAAGIPVEPLAIAFNTLLDIVYTIPRNYDAACYAYGIDIYPLYLENFITDEIANDEGNMLNWANPQYDEAVDTFMNGADYDTVLDACHEAQQIFVENVPMMVLYSNYEVNAHRTDKWENFIVIPGYGTAGMNRWNPRKVMLKAGQPDRDPLTGCGGTFVTLIASEIDSQNPLTSTSVYGHYPLSQVYDSLTGLNDPRDHSAIKASGGLAYDWTITSLEAENAYQFDFTIFDNATWHDGEPVTAEDVVFSYNYIYDHQIPGYSLYFPYFNSCVKVDSTHVRITSNGQSYWAFENLRGWTILPQHIWEGIVSPVTFSNPEPVGFGPFTWYRRIEGEYIELRFWDEYHYGILGHTAKPEEPTPVLWLYVTVGALVIVVVLLGSVWYLRKK